MRELTQRATLRLRLRHQTRQDDGLAAIQAQTVVTRTESVQGGFDAGDLVPVAFLLCAVHFGQLLLMCLVLAINYFSVSRVGSFAPKSCPAV
jgi:hypothetical protein